MDDSFNYFLETEFTAVKAARRQRKLDRKRHAELPLFAEIIDDVEPLPEVDAIQRKWQARQVKFIERFAFYHREIERQADISRAVAGELCMQRELYQLDDYRWETFPGDPVYSLDYWHHVMMVLRVAQAIRHCGVRSEP